MKLKQLPGMLLAAMLVMSSVPFPVSAADIGGTEVLEEKTDSPAGETSGGFSGDLTGDDTVFGMIENELVEEEADAVFTEEEADAVFTEEEGDAAFEEETADDAVNDGSAVDPAADPVLSVDGAAAEPDASADDATDDREDEPDIGGAAADDEEDEPVIDEAAADDEDVEPVIGEAAADEKTIEADKAEADFLSDTVQDSVTEDTAEDALYSGGETETPEYPISGPEPGGEIVASGTCDENLTWSLDAEGTLTISGIGEMTADPAPWNEKADDIKKVIIESGVISIGDYAFFTCRNLKSISIADSVNAIGEGAFAFCTNLADITIPDHVASISCRAFTGCESLTSITIPYGVKDIGDYTFCECTSLTDITIPETVTSIGNYAFDVCKSLENITIPDGVKSVGSCAFSFCSSLQSIKIPREVTSIEYSTFSDCSSLTNITLPDSITKIDKEAFSGCSSLPDISIPRGVTSIGMSAFYNCSSLTNVTIPDQVTSIMSGTFENCSSLTGITIPDDVTSIGKEAFSGCSSLTDITIPDGVTSIGYAAFFGCSSLTSFTLPGSITEIDEDEFMRCGSLTSITIPNTVKSVGDGAFDDCSSLTDVYYQGTEESWNNINISDRNEDLLNAYIIFLGEKNLKNASVTGLSAKTYNGRAIIQSPVVKYNGKTLTEGNDYTVSYKNNTHVGTAKVTFTGKGGYTGVRTETFRINKAEQPVKVSVSASPVSVGDTAAVKVSGAKGDVTYKTSSKSIATVSSTGTIKGVKVGKAQITVNFAATSDFNPCSKTVTIKIVPAATASITAANQPAGIRLTWKKVAGANAYFIFRDGTQIAAIRDGSVTYTDKKANTNGAKYVYKIITSASVTGRSTHSTSVTTYRMDRPAISSLTNSGAGRLTAKWGKNAKATGYQIHYCPDKTFETGNKSATISGASTVTKTIAGLTKGKTYYVRIRTFKTVGSTKYFSAWSTVRSVKIAK